jgi:hypothetical protein
MANPSDSTLHLSMRCGKTELSIGSGVLYRRRDKFYVVTAWHNLSGRHSQTFRLISPTQAVPDNVRIAVPQTVSLGGSIRLPITVPLHDEDAATYLIHPDPWPRKDVAVLPLDIDGFYPRELELADGTRTCQQMPLRQAADGAAIGLEVQPIQDCEGALKVLEPSAENRLHEGDDLFVLGYPLGISDSRMAPIWKRATVASDPQSGWNGQPCFLIDCASRQGMSGAPVILYSRHGDVREGGMRYIGSGPVAALCGIYVGRLAPSEAKGSDALFEAQLGTVWKTEVIDQIIDAGKRGPHADAIHVSPAALELALSRAWPREKGDDEAHLNLPVVRWNVVNCGAFGEHCARGGLCAIRRACCGAAHGLTLELRNCRAKHFSARSGSNATTESHMILRPPEIEPWDVSLTLRDLCMEMLLVHEVGASADAATVKRWHKSLTKAARAHSALARSCEDIVEKSANTEHVEAMKRALTTAMGQARYWPRADRW